MNGVAASGGAGRGVAFATSVWGPPADRAETLDTRAFVIGFMISERELSPIHSAGGVQEELCARMLRAPMV